MENEMFRKCSAHEKNEN